MEKVEKKVVKSKYLAFAMSWLGFRYVQVGKGYIFDKTEKFDKAWNQLKKLRDEIGEVK